MLNVAPHTLYKLLHYIPNLLQNPGQASSVSLIFFVSRHIKPPLCGLEYNTICFPRSDISTVCAFCGASLIIHGSKNYSAYVCNNYWNKGTSVCSCKHRLPRDVAESAILGKLSDILMNKTVIDKLVTKANQALKRKDQKPKIKPSDLKKREVELTQAIENLLDLAENGEVTDSLKSRLNKKEQELELIKKKLDSTPTSDRHNTIVTSDWLRNELLNLQNLINPSSAKAEEINLAIKKIYPEKIKIEAIESNGKMYFKLRGKAKPFNALQNIPYPLNIHSGAGT